MSKTKEVAVSETPVDPVISAWEEATQIASVLVSYDVAKDEYLDALAGIDMVITGVTYRPGMEGRSYVSLECMLSPRWDIRRVNLARAASGLPKLDTLDDLPWEPGEHVVINSGSTGIYRQITEILYTTGAIKLQEPIVPTGKRGECSFDASVASWLDVMIGERWVNPDGEAVYTNRTIRVRCRKGVRISSYTTDDYGDATTYYLA